MIKYFRAGLFLFLSIFSISLFAQYTNSQYDIGKLQKSNWKGYNRIDFTFNSFEARIVFPEKPLAGNPWVWRARFPGWHTEADSILIASGFHLAFINTANKFGSPDAIDIWDEFYQYLIDEYNLDKKVSLMGVSRGGLFIYNWAKRNPNQVHCIYGEAPVCDFKSWPGGFGGSEGSASDWEKLKKEYGFKSDEEAKNYANNPINNLEELAKHKIPILHMISLKDEIVPAEENTLVLINKYISLGGQATVVPCTQSEQKLKGHHFNIESPQLVADFIKYHAVDKYVK